MIFRSIIKVESHISKKNNRPIWRGRLGKSKRLIEAENHLIKELRAEWWRYGNLENNGLTIPIDFPVNVMIMFYFNKDTYYTKKGNVNRKIPDLSNLYQLVEDCMEKAGILSNDHYICGHDGSRRLPTQSQLDPSYLEIIITKL